LYQALQFFVGKKTASIPCTARKGKKIHDQIATIDYSSSIEIYRVPKIDQSKFKRMPETDFDQNSLEMLTFVP
jgi:hypothetical protein